MGVGVDLFRSRRQLLVDLGHGAGHRRVKVRNGLHRLDTAKNLALLNFGAGLGQIDEDNVSQGVLGVIGNAYLPGLACYFNPFVLLACSGTLLDRPSVLISFVSLRDSANRNRSAQGGPELGFGGGQRTARLVTV